MAHKRKKPIKGKPAKGEPFQVKLGRHFSVTDFELAEAEDRAYWAAQSVAAWLRAMEMMRRLNYGDDACGRMERVLEIVQQDNKKASGRAKDLDDLENLPNHPSRSPMVNDS